MEAGPGSARRGWAFGWAAGPWTGVGDTVGRVWGPQETSSPVPRPRLLPLSVLGLLCHHWWSRELSRKGWSRRGLATSPRGGTLRSPGGPSPLHALGAAWRPRAPVGPQASGGVTAFSCPVFGATGLSVGLSPKWHRGKSRTPEVSWKPGTPDSISRPRVHLGVESPPSPILSVQLSARFCFVKDELFNFLTKPYDMGAISIFILTIKTFKVRDVNLFELTKEAGK